MPVAAIHQTQQTNNGINLLSAFNEIPSTIVDNEFECAICLDPIPRGTSVKPLPACNHVFHEDCLSTWLQGGNNSCPICRYVIMNMPPEPEQNEAPRAVLENDHGDNNWVLHPVFWA
ncbi:hypothetical protein niasHS_016039 [Heterodera schachtii]|uniref:RING-type domain-containing protein n=1 Tax=Heterodera schachtii TaxID=97005 RepID=A0ABD2HXT0_HETSC